MSHRIQPALLGLLVVLLAGTGALKVAGWLGGDILPAFGAIGLVELGFASALCLPSTRDVTLVVIAGIFIGAGAVTLWTAVTDRGWGGRCSCLGIVPATRAQMLLMQAAILGLVAMSTARRRDGVRRPSHGSG